MQSLFAPNSHDLSPWSQAPSPQKPSGKNSPQKTAYSSRKTQVDSFQPHKKPNFQRAKPAVTIRQLPKNPQKQAFFAPRQTQQPRQNASFHGKNYPLRRKRNSPTLPCFLSPVPNVEKARNVEQIPPPLSQTWKKPETLSKSPCPLSQTWKNENPLSKTPCPLSQTWKKPETLSKTPCTLPQTWKKPETLSKTPCPLSQTWKKPETLSKTLHPLSPMFPNPSLRAGAFAGTNMIRFP